MTSHMPGKLPNRHGPMLIACAALMALGACTFPSTPLAPKKASPAASRKLGPPDAKPSPVGLGPGALVRTVAPGEQIATLVGKVKLISDHGGSLISDQGGGIISNNGGTIVSNNSGGLISDQGSGLIANNAGALVGKRKLRLADLQDGGMPRPSEFLLADATVTLHDATGRQLLDADGNPLHATTDASGAYRLTAPLPAENLVMRIKLWNGGELSAILARGSEPTREVPIDTASTLGATYVLNRFVKGDQARYDKLPAAEAERLRAELLAAQQHVTRAPRYEAEALIGLADELRKQAPAVDKTLEDIEALLLGGMGDGKQATRVALGRPRALALTPDGTLIVGEQDFGRLRRVAPDGTLTTWVDGVGGAIKANFVDLTDLALLPDGALLVASHGLRKVVRVSAAGTVEPFAGTGALPAAGAPEPAPGLATEQPMEPTALAVGAGGQVWIGQEERARIFEVSPDGQCRPLERPPGWLPAMRLAGLAAGADGTLYALGRLKDGQGEVARRAADGTWSTIASGLAVYEGDLAVAADGRVYVCEDLAGRLSLLAPGQAPVPIAGAGAPAGAPALSAPAGLHLAADGTLYVSDQRANQVFARDAAGAWRHVAGAEQGEQRGDDLAINAPAGLAFDPQGQLVVTEGAGHSVKRWDGQALSTLAGGVRGDAGDGGPAAAARFDTPWGLAYRGEELLVMDSRNARLRAIAPDGTVRTLVGVPGEAEGRPLRAGERVPADEYVVERGGGLAVAPDGTVYWASISLHQIVRLRPDGTVELVAGKAYADGAEAEDGEDGPAAEVALAAPLGLALDPADPDALYFTEATNMRVRKVVGLASATPRVETVAGLGRAPSLVRILSLTPGWEQAEEGVAAREALFIGPAALCFDRDGAMYVAEVGTDNLNQLATGGEGAPLLGGGAGTLPRAQARIRRIGRDGRVTAIAGPGGLVLADPAGTDPLGMPTGLAFDRQGRLAFVDIRANAIRFLPRQGW